MMVYDGSDMSDGGNGDGDQSGAGGDGVNITYIPLLLVVLVLCSLSYPLLVKQIELSTIGAQ